MIWFRNSEEIFLSFFLKCLWERTAILLPLNIYYINWKSLKGSGHVRQPNGFGFEKGSNQEKSYHKRWHHSDWKRVKRRQMLKWWQWIVGPSPLLCIWYFQCHIHELIYCCFLTSTRSKDAPEIQTPTTMAQGLRCLTISLFPSRLLVNLNINFWRWIYASTYNNRKENTLSVKLRGWR